MMLSLILKESKLRLEIIDRIQSKKLEEQRSKNKIQAEQNKIKILEDGIDQIEDSIA